MKRFKKNRQSTKVLLQQGEGNTIDYKRNAIVDTEDLVAFANSESGGHLLLGVEEQTDEDGRMIGVPVGVVLDDALARNIQGKAHSCVPPIKIIVSEENGATNTPFVRVDIPPSKNRPHCTGAGTYKVRSLASNKPLLPHEILDLLLVRESNLFLNRFSASTQSLLDSVQNLQAEIIPPITDLRIQVNQAMAHALTEVETAQQKMINSLQDIPAPSDQNAQPAISAEQIEQLIEKLNLLLAQTNSSE